MASASMIKIIAIVITFVFMAQCIPNIIYYYMIAYSDSFKGTNVWIAMFLMYLNIVFLISGLIIVIYLIVSGLTKEPTEVKVMEEQNKYYNQPREDEFSSLAQKEKKKEMIDIGGYSDPMISRSDKMALIESSLFE